MKKTFYIASPFQNKEAVQQLARYLESRDMRWVHDHDWTAQEKGLMEAPREKRVAWGMMDMRGAVAADLFVLLLEGKPSAGAHAELGARWTAGKEIYIIRGNGSRHLFHDLPGVTEYPDVESFVFSVFGP